MPEVLERRKISAVVELVDKISGGSDTQEEG